MDWREKVRELARIKADPYHFLKYVKIQEPGELVVEYELWGHLVDFYRALEEYALIDLIKSKKIGISWALAVHALRKIMTVPGWNVLEFSKGKLEAQELLGKSRVVFFNLPAWIREEPDYELEFDSTEKFGFKGMRSKIVAYPSTETAGIGETAGTVIHDEADFHECYEINLSHTRATIADTKNGQLISVSTVDKTKPDSYFKRHWKAGEGSGYPEAGSNGFKALFYGVFSRPDRDEAWYQQMVRENEWTPWVVEGNYPRSAVEALSPISAQSCFKKEVLDRLWANSTGQPDIRRGFIHILCPPRVGVQYVAGADVGEGVGLDYSALTIVGKEGLRQEVAAVIYSNNIKTDLFAYEIVQLCSEFHNPLLAIENNSLGVAVTNKVNELGYKKLFSSEAEEKRRRNLSIDGNEKIGWTTGEKNKQLAIVELIQVVDSGSFITRYRPMITEFMEMQWVKGKPVPTGKTHGDLVISAALAHQMFKFTGGSFKPSLYCRGKRIF